MDLYQHDLRGAAWKRPCGGNTGDSGTDESCVEIADIPGGKALRDSKRQDLPPLRFTDDEWSGFMRAYGLD